MEGKSIVVCIVVAILGLFSTIVGLVFELAPDKTMAAFFLVLAALICVIVAQIIITISTDCGCCSGRSSSSALQALAILGFCFSWLASIAAVIVHVIGGAKQYGVQFPEFSHLVSSLSSIWAENGYCYKVKHGIFGAAAALSFGAVSLGIVTYVVLGFGHKRRRITGVRVSSTNEVHNRGNASSPMDSPIAIALPDVPATPMHRFKAVEERHQTPTDLRPTPVILQV
ncbi:hypothetical protein RND81_04G003400 [Saponaria officinalis]|uniref:Transmembrane protein n=1 Tax=Saponaria officinalis TaxID=3572 RepID=A0AAW1LHF6_SAPOF